MTLYNADGSVAEMSGNGVRCLAAAVRRATTSDRDELVVRHGGRVEDRSTRDGRTRLGYGSVDMGEVTFGEDIDGALGCRQRRQSHVGSCDDDGWNDAAREELAAKLAAQLGGANVEFVTVLGEEHLSIRVIERGVGWTLACGTGSCAVAALARRDGLEWR